MCLTYKVEKHMRPNLVPTIACEQHFSREAVFPWTETLACVALETAIGTRNDGIIVAWLTM